MKRLRIGHGTVVAYVALFFAMSGTAVAATGGMFVLGKSNAATTVTSLTNTSGTALTLNSKIGTPPLTVNQTTKVPRLNSDYVDGLDGAQLQRRVTGTCTGGSAVSAVATSGAVTCQAPVPGPQGPAGPTGATGPTGPTGPAGAPGAGTKLLDAAVPGPWTTTVLTQAPPECTPDEVHHCADTPGGYTQSTLVTKTFSLGSPRFVYAMGHARAVQDPYASCAGTASAGRLLMVVKEMSTARETVVAEATMAPGQRRAYLEGGDAVRLAAGTHTVTVVWRHGVCSSGTTAGTVTVDDAAVAVLGY